MSGKGKLFSVLGWVIAIAVTAVLCAIAWWLWNEVPGFLRRTELADFRYLASLIAVFFVLSVLNPLIRWVWDRFDGEH